MYSCTTILWQKSGGIKQAIRCIITSNFMIFFRSLCNTSAKHVVVQINIMYMYVVVCFGVSVCLVMFLQYVKHIDN